MDGAGEVPTTQAEVSEAVWCLAGCISAPSHGLSFANAEVRAGVQCFHAAQDSASTLLLQAHWLATAQADRASLDGVLSTVRADTSELSKQLSAARADRSALR